MPDAAERATGVEHDRGADVGRELRRGRRAPARGSAGAGHQSGQNSAVPLSRISWLVTVGICLIAALLVLLNGYVGYFGVLLAVGASAAVNLR